ncbi:MAG: helix-turn-helix domain-containing protein [Lachnospiraceae bacterium]|nr:helix-turn-helix domain-containing protein [Lachnospiraceae bacterium]
MEAAKQLLLNGKSVTAVAAELSFSTSSYFTAVFKKYTTITPSEFLSTAYAPPGTLG